MAKRHLKNKHVDRPRRGTPEQTRQRLVEAAAEAFNRDGYDGTDSNRIAREAGYAPGTFYRHFVDKRAVFLAVYEEWVTREFRDIAATLEVVTSSKKRAEGIVEVFLAHHQRWHGFRASLRAMVAVDQDIRAFWRAQRSKQLELLAQMQKTHGAGKVTGRERDALLLFTLERAADALADGESEALGLDPEGLRALLVALVAERL